MTAPPRRPFAIVSLSLCLLVICVAASGWSAGSNEPPASDPPKPCPEQEKGPKIMSPLNESITTLFAVDVIAKCPQGEACELTVDGKPTPWTPYEGMRRAARVRMSPGLHTITVGDKKVRCVVALNKAYHDAPSDWRFMKSHYLSGGDDQCSECHEVERDEARTAVGPFLGTKKACLDCHEPIDFELIHEHKLKPLEDCRVCHAVHGSFEEDHLLKAPVTKLCEQCHDPEDKKKD